MGNEIIYGKRADPLALPLISVDRGSLMGM